MGREAEPQRQPASAARQVVGEVGRVPLRTGPVAVVGMQHVQVLGVLGVGAPTDLRVAVQQGARVERREQPLVGIDDEAVGGLDAGEAVASARRREGRPAVGAVDVHPRVQHGTCRGGRREVVDDAGVGRPGRGDDGEQPGPIVVRQCAERGLEGRAREATDRIGRHRHDVGVHRPRRGGDRGVGAAGRHDQPARAVHRPVGSLPPAPARRDEGAQVAGRAATDEHAAGRRREAGEVGDPAQRLVLGVDGPAALQPRAAVDARRPDDEVEQDRRFGRCRRARTTRSGGDRRRCTPAPARRRRPSVRRAHRCHPG